MASGQPLEKPAASMTVSPAALGLTGLSGANYKTGSSSAATRTSLDLVSHQGATRILCALANAPL